MMGIFFREWIYRGTEATRRYRKDFSLQAFIGKWPANTPLTMNVSPKIARKSKLCKKSILLVQFRNLIMILAK
jgi:hypothetical protein